MVPREAERGASFKGAGLYYLHDKNADTAERVEFTHAENVPTQDPQKALKWMAWTAMHAEDLKRQAGESNRGRKSEKPVYAFSLAWHPEEQPDKVEMIVAARQLLEKLGLREHETLMVAHRDREHSHLHCIVNLVHPETGRSNTLKNSRKKMSEWAEAYETERGRIYCEQRVENNQKRKQGKTVKHEDQPLEIKARITQAYFAADNGKAFQAALQEQGWKLAYSKRFVILDARGNIVGELYRNIDGVKSKDIKAKLSDLDRQSLDQARGQGEKDRRERKLRDADYPDRDKQERDWQEKTISAGINAEREKVATGLKNRTQDRHLSELGTFYEENLRKRQALEYQLENSYGQQERTMRRDLQQIETALQSNGRAKLWWMKLTGQLAFHAEREAEQLRSTIATIEQRKAEMTAAVEAGITRQREQIEQRQAHERGNEPRLRPAQVDEYASSIEQQERRDLRASETLARVREETPQSRPAEDDDPGIQADGTDAGEDFNNAARDAAPEIAGAENENDLPAETPPAPPESAHETQPLTATPAAAPDFVESPAIETTVDVQESFTAAASYEPPAVDYALQQQIQQATEAAASAYRDSLENTDYSRGNPYDKDAMSGGSDPVADDIAARLEQAQQNTRGHHM